MFVDWRRRHVAMTGAAALVAAIIMIPVSQCRILASGTDWATQTTAAGLTNESVMLPEALPDPIEPANRAIWAFNKGLMTGVVKPTARVYRFVVRKPVRRGIRNFGRNITYPGRLINNFLQGKPNGAADETARFLCNTIFGLGGFFDVATNWKIPTSDADFGQTFGRWGWKPHAYVMLPIYGPSNERDTLGLAVDTAANPLTYLVPYPFVANNPLTYFAPYTYANYAIMYNSLSDTVDDYVRFSRTEKDPYSEIEYASGYVRENQVVDFRVRGEPDAASLETLRSVFFSFKDPEFPNRGTTRSVLITSTGRNLKFTFWLQRGEAPVVYIVPGLGSHRLAASALALAELVYDHGFSVVCVSNPFNYEFMEQASTAAVPAYAPVDAHDLHVALSETDRQLRKRNPHRLGARALMGYSMGAFQSLFVAGIESANDPRLIQFDRYVAINPPVRLVYGMSKLDEFFQAPAAWPAEERPKDVENTFLKVAAFTKNSFTPQTSLPFSGIESKFLIGVVFRLILRDAIYSSQERHNQHVLQHPVSKFRREELYREILRYSYRDYFDRFVVPYYLTRGIDLRTADALEGAGDLRTYTATLKANPRIRVITNRNDFLLDGSDADWLQATFSPDRLTLFEQGGHLGNLADPSVQEAILRTLDGLGPRARVE
jgi:ABC-type transporter lipoprotein component MlaA